MVKDEDGFRHRSAADYWKDCVNETVESRLGGNDQKASVL